ncbi:MAG: penicillin-binding protein 1A [Cyanobacteria bacterium CRU_2_1]|nr:penicillin-binding protein 1A [Hydrococcus sp. RU_2_2]NJR59314.1 penicillin-binding protein 1A [Cyanobacteria bacterium CRU_2_1]
MAQISEPLENYAELPKLKRPLYQRWWAWSIVSIGFGIGGAVIAAQTTLVSIERDLPDTSEALTYVRNGTLTIKASDGTVLQQLGPATRDKVTLEQMPDRLPEAFIASEDEDFYEHDGVNYRSIARAFFKNLTAGEVIEGGSTITQQLARIVFLDQERSLGRKVKEALLAQKMERELDKDQILERYLNLVYLGSGAYGVADAAWIFFSKKVDELTLSESAMIAGMAPAPSVYSPLVNPDLAKQRRDIVLQRMVDAGFITESERISAVAEPIALKPGTPKNLYSEVPYFTSYIQQQLPQYVSPEQLELGGLTIETTLNLQWQKQAQDVVKDAIANYGPYEGFEQAALVCIDPRTGEIKALVGGDDFEKSQFNRATQAQRQPGSTFKTLVYSTAIAGGISPYAGYVDAKLVVDGYEPQNYGRSYRGSVTLRDALTSSINIVAVKTLIDVGFDPVIQMAKRMGIQSELIPAYSLALGSSEVNLLELTSAYGTLANKGNHVEVHGITRIIDRYGNVVYEAKFTPEQAIDADSASIMTWMLEEVVRSGTGWEASLPDRPVAGKTGTSENRRDLWFIGYVPQLVTGVWLGNDDSSPTYGASSTAARTWYDFMITLTDEVSAEQFPDIPAVDGREPTIELQPVKPGRISESSTASSEESTWEDGNYSGYDSGYSSTSEPSPSASPTEGDASSGESPPTEASADPASSEPPPPIDEGIPEPPIVDSAPPPPILDQPPPISEPPPVVVPVETAPEPLPLPGGADN